MIVWRFEIVKIMSIKKKKLLKQLIDFYFFTNLIMTVFNYKKHSLKYKIKKLNYDGQMLSQIISIFYMFGLHV